MNESLKRKIDFLVIGSQKSGTTALDKYLRLHPGIGMPEKKETHFFDKHIIGIKPKMVDHVYHNHFNLLDLASKIVGEITPGYLFIPEVSQRIYNYNPNIKLVAILRNPIERAYSHWGMQKEKGIEELSFDECIVDEPERLSKMIPKHRKKFAYISRGFYATQLKCYFNLFKKNQFHIIKYDDFVERQKEAVDGIITFLDLDPRRYNFEQINIHLTSYQEQISKEAKRKLIDLFRSEILELEKMLNWNCQNWLE